MKQILIILVLLTASHTYTNNQPPKTEQQHKHNNAAHDIDDLLDDALEDGVKDEVIQPKEVSTPEIWLRKIGGALFSGYLGAKYYTYVCWRAITGASSATDEEQSSDAPDNAQE